MPQNYIKAIKVVDHTYLTNLTDQNGKPFVAKTGEKSVAIELDMPAVGNQNQLEFVVGLSRTLINAHIDFNPALDNNRAIIICSPDETLIGVLQNNGYLRELENVAPGQLRLQIQEARQNGRCLH